MGMMKWLAIGMVAVAFAAVSLLGEVPGIARNQQAGASVERLALAMRQDEVATGRAIKAATRRCLIERAGSRMPEPVVAFFARAIMLAAVHGTSSQKDGSVDYIALLAPEAATMREALVTMDERQRTLAQAILTDFSERPELLTGCVAGNFKDNSS